MIPLTMLFSLVFVSFESYVELIDLRSSALYDYGNSLEIDDDGGFVVAGFTSGNIFISKFESNGNHLWTTLWSSSDIDSASSVQKVGDAYILCGYESIYDSTNHNMLISKYSNDGSHLWSRSIGDSDGQEYGTGGKETTGGYVMVGWEQGGGVYGTTIFGKANLLSKWDTLGNRLWAYAFGQSDTLSDYVFISRDVDILVDGGIVVVGKVHSYNGENDWAFVSKFSSTGSHSYTFLLGWYACDEESNAVSGTSDGGFVVVLNSQSFDGEECEPNNRNDILLSKFSSDGEHEWTSMYSAGNGFSTSSHSVIESSGGGYVVSGGGKIPFDTNPDMGRGCALLVKFNEDGTFGWSKTIAEASDIEEDSFNVFAHTGPAYDVKEISEGVYVVTGVRSKTIVSTRKKILLAVVNVTECGCCGGLTGCAIGDDDNQGTVVTSRVPAIQNVSESIICEDVTATVTVKYPSGDIVTDRIPTVTVICGTSNMTSSTDIICSQNNQDDGDEDVFEGGEGKLYVVKLFCLYFLSFFFC